MIVGLAVFATVGLGSVALDRYVAAADRHNVTDSVRGRMVDLRQALAAGSLSLASAHPFVRVVVGAGERIVSPSAIGVEIPRSWVDDGSTHLIETDAGDYLVLTNGITVDGLLATATVGEPVNSSPRARSALRRGLVLLSVLGGAVAMAMTMATSRRRAPLPPPVAGARTRSVIDQSAV